MKPPMIPCFSRTFHHPCTAGGVAAALMITHALCGEAPPAAPAHGWTLSTTAGAKTGYDNNVLLQNSGDQAKIDTWVNAVNAQVSLSNDRNPLCKVLLSYAPEGVLYDGMSDENHLTHKGTLNLGGKSGDFTWELLNNVTRIDGDNLGPIYTDDGGMVAAELPAVGGVPVRDRRDAAIYKNSLKLTRSFGKMFVRPVATFYHHNFMTEQHARNGSEPGFLGYENYVDRQEIGGGADVGYEAWSKTWLVAGVRAGHQKQYELLGNPSPYGNDYLRVLAGIEGSPAGWLKLNLLAGPDFREYDDKTPDGFDEGHDYVFIDATATLTPTPEDAITLAVKRYLQPSFTSHSLYEDIVYEAAYKRKLDNRYSVGTGFKAYHADWRPPVARDEWVFTPSASLTYTHSASLSAELSYSFDWAYSQIPDTIEREYTRHLVWLGVKCSF